MRGKLERIKLQWNSLTKGSNRRRAARLMQLHGKLSDFCFLIYMLGDDWCTSPCRPYHARIPAILFLRHYANWRPTI
jgi:hypothetical protein